EKGTVDFVVSGNSLFDEYDSAPRLNVWFIEDGLIGRQANGGTMYEHIGVMRTSLTGTWGEPINVHDGKFPYNFDVNLGETTLKKPANGWILAFLSNFDATNVNNCEVLNASRIYLKDMNGNVDGIDTVGSNGGAMQSVAVYGIDGRQQSGMQRGINIVRQQRVDGSYETVKVLR
ncbi:MAG: Omp28-related outer membrane protein, partial [Bacteroidales bacterium]|nr:Omp28-related outer membrane protein [Candidatus Equimonas enterica]